MRIEKLLEIGVKKNASDLHLHPNLKPLLRIYGTLSEIPELNPMSSDEIKKLLFSFMSTEQRDIFEKELVIDMALSIPDLGDFRVSALHLRDGVAGVLRILPDKIPTCAELGLPPVINRLLGLSHGLILVTGSTGSGKTTSLASMINQINRHQASHIITIEDPIEYVHHNIKSVIKQLQIGRDTASFASALRASLRQDPDVLLLGELRDFETMRLALTAAETGHLVFATLHASSAALAINRFVDMCPLEENVMVRNMLSETLQAVMCQTLVRSIAKGRVAAFEIMLSTPAIRHYIRKDMPGHMESTIQTSGDLGMCTLSQSLQELVEKHIITSVAAEATLMNRGSFREFDESPNGKSQKR
jgi:twitching motility protein PilT